MGTVSVLFKTSFGFSIALFSLFTSESDPACQGDEKKLINARIFALIFGGYDIKFYDGSVV